MSQKKFAKLKKDIYTHQFVVFVVLALVITGLMTFISLEIYVSSGAVKLDLSRPGYEKLRNDVQQSSSDQTFSASGDVNSETIKDFNSRVDSSVKDLKNSGKFGGSDALSDTSLGL